MLSVWCIAHMKPSVWINPCLWAEAWDCSPQLVCICVCLCVCMCVCVKCRPHSTPQMGFHFNWQLLGSIHQDDKLMGGGTVEVHPECSRRGIEVEVFRLCVVFVCTSLSSFSDGLLIGQSLHQTPLLCVCQGSVYAGVCTRVHLFVSAGCIACRSIDLKLSLWSLAFVCQIYLSCRLSFHCHSLTHGSDTSWALHRWENNTYLWPLELFLLRKPLRKNALAAHASLNVYQGTLLLRRGGE